VKLEKIKEEDIYVLAVDLTTTEANNFYEKQTYI